jgi:hypothetical protein
MHTAELTFFKEIGKAIHIYENKSEDVERKSKETRIFFFETFSTFVFICSRSSWLIIFYLTREFDMKLRD